MTQAYLAAVPAALPIRLVTRVRDALSQIPYSALALFARCATFSVFFRSGMVKLSDWSATLMLFQNEYRVPILPPQVAAYMAASMELGLSTLILLGLFTRVSVAGLLGMVAVIQIFVFPEGWPDHIQWTAFMVFLLARGPGALSLDRLFGWLVARDRHMPRTVAQTAP
jgi:putative oxidoreductase